eukprot:TRINITY_DN1667_c0_g2_i10.p1 TRINITY_DN1667_c0_g2~~TRINITY_DN1667_c0_g2_i10.p1  ORF type:complete len:271 (+),score=31.48 TRINITY_DN1667_c0_g2_i10:162-974(+)
MDPLGFEQFQGGFFQESQAPTATQTPTAYNQSVDDRIYLDGQMVNIVLLCGKVKEINNGVGAQQYTLYTVHDGSGRISVKLWTDNGDQFDSAQNIVINDWVRIFGHVKSAENVGEAPFVQAFCIRKVTDPMEIAYQQLKVIQEHLLIGKYGGGTAPVAGQANQSSIGGVNQNIGGMNQNIGVGLGNQPSMGMMSPGVPGTPGASNPQLENAIVQLIISDGNSDGTFFNSICERFQGQYPSHQIRAALQKLTFNGRILALDDQCTRFKSIY